MMGIELQIITRIECNVVELDWDVLVVSGNMHLAEHTCLEKREIRHPL